MNQRTGMRRGVGVQYRVLLKPRADDAVTDRVFGLARHALRLTTGEIELRRRGRTVWLADAADRAAAEALAACLEERFAWPAMVVPAVSGPDRGVDTLVAALCTASPRRASSAPAAAAPPAADAPAAEESPTSEAPTPAGRRPEPVQRAGGGRSAPGHVQVGGGGRDKPLRLSADEVRAAAAAAGDDAFESDAEALDVDLAAWMAPAPAPAAAEAPFRPEGAVRPEDLPDRRDEIIDDTPAVESNPDLPAIKWGAAAGDDVALELDLERAGRTLEPTPRPTAVSPTPLPSAAPRLAPVAAPAPPAGFPVGLLAAAAAGVAAVVAVALLLL
ncbi:MAG: hypothetical protein H6704_27620 [Myxococcales bacterium]|nr:hypothetical protein [Myxococcales bacterium]